MESIMNSMMVAEAALFSFLLALGITWMLMRGLFRLMPATVEIAEPTRLATIRQEASHRREAA